MPASNAPEALLRDIAAAMVSRPDRIMVRRYRAGDGSTFWELSGAPEDAGKLIGRGGSHCRAFEFLVTKMGSTIGEDWRFKLDSDRAASVWEQPTRKPETYDATPTRDLLARILETLPIGAFKVEPPRVNGEAMLFFFDVLVAEKADAFAMTTLEHPDEPESSMIGALGTLFRAAARKAGVRYQINVVHPLRERNAMTTDTLLETAVKLKEIHRLQKWLYGDKWAEKVAEIEPLIRDCAYAERCTVTAAAIRIAKRDDMDPRMALLVLAVAVEIKD